MEYLDLLDEYGQPTGKTKERTLVHRDGDLHRTAHVWIARRDPGTNSIQLLMQKRSDRKDSYPGCYDISSAGHVPAGEGFTESALRELKEELGISALPEQLRFLFYHKGYAQAEFYGKTFINNEYSAVYLYTDPVRGLFSLFAGGRGIGSALDGLRNSAGTGNAAQREVLYLCGRAGGNGSVSFSVSLRWKYVAGRRQKKLRRVHAKNLAIPSYVFSAASLLGLFSSAQTRRLVFFLFLALFWLQVSRVFLSWRFTWL